MNVLVMNFVRRSLFLLSLAVFLSASLFGGSDDFVSGMKTRLPKVLVAKDAGTIGEGTDGLLHSREGGAAETQALVAAENKDRKALFVRNLFCRGICTHRCRFGYLYPNFSRRVAFSTMDE